MSVNVSIVLETRSKTKDKLFPVKLRLTFERDQRYYAAVVNNKRLYMSQRQFHNMMSASKRSSTRKGLDGVLDKADTIIESIEPFSFNEFSAIWNTNKAETNDLFRGFRDTIERLKNENRVGTSMSYETAMNSFISYTGSTLKYNLVTHKWLNDYVKYMQEEGKSSTTTAIYLRTLRVILRSEGKPFVKVYPFEGFTMPISKGRKNEALTLDQIKELAEYKTDKQNKQKALDFWLFSYNCGGANYEDIFRFKWEDINLIRGEISFYRRKTRLTRKVEKKPIIMPITERMKATIIKYGTEQKPSEYVFPILNNDMSETRKKLRVKYVTKNFNKHTKDIGEELKFDVKLSSTVARHSRASVMNYQGQHYSIIGDMLGHSSIITTENYLKGFSRESQNEAMKQSAV